jgi:hypothetical protein
MNKSYNKKLLYKSFSSLVAKSKQIFSPKSYAFWGLSIAMIALFLPETSISSEDYITSWDIDNLKEVASVETSSATIGDILIVNEEKGASMASPVFTKSFTNDPVEAGDIVNLEFTISYDALATGNATGIGFTDDLNAVIPGLAAIGLPIYVCGGTLSGTTNLSFTGGSMNPGDVCVISVPVEVPTGSVPGAYTSTTSALTATVGGLAVTGNVATDDLIIGGLNFTKEFIDDPVVPGALTTLRFTIDNRTTFDATSILFTDNLSNVLPGLEAEAPLPVNPCGSPTSISGTSFLIFWNGTVIAGTTCSFDVMVRVPAGAASGTYTNNTSNLNATLDGSNSVLPIATDNLVVNGTLISLSKSFTDDPVAPGSPVTVEYTLTNLDPANALSNIAFTDDFDGILTGLLATGLPVVGCGGTLSSADGGMTVDFTGGTLAAGATCTFSVTLQTPAAALFGTVVTSTTSGVTGDIGGFAVVGDPASDDLMFQSLSLSMADSPDPVSAGGTMDITFTITNHDPVNVIDQISFTDDLDAFIPGMIATVLPAAGTCGPPTSGVTGLGTSLITFSTGRLNPDQSCSFTVTVLVPCGTTDNTYTNTTSTITGDGIVLGMVAPGAIETLLVMSIPVAFTAPVDLCIDAGVQADLGGGLPSGAGGVYSGTGVTDDGNGLTYSFDPAAAEVGTHTLTYTFTDDDGCAASATDDVEVFALPAVTFTAPADLCIDAGVQADLGGGLPSGAGGVYSGTGVTDDGNGLTYSFDPAPAGVGTYTLTYTFTDANGCAASATDDVEVFALPAVAFTAPVDLCIDAGVQAGLGGGLPSGAGGVYSGTGVTDDGNGLTYSFDPAAAGVGIHTLTYTYTDPSGCTSSATDDVEVFALPVVTLNLPVDLCTSPGGGGLPIGGVYSGPGVTDDGNGTSFSFDPIVAGPAVITITFTFTDGNGCTASATDTYVYTTPPVANCPADITVSNDAGQCDAVVTFMASATDNCTGVTTSSVPASGSVFPIGTTLVTVTATDAAGNTDVCMFDVTVNDTELPIISCPADAAVNTDPGQCSTVVLFPDALAIDNCGVATVIQTAGLPSGSPFPVGINTVEYTATDVNGNMSVCSFTITVTDNEPAIPVCQDITIQLDTNGAVSILASEIDGGSNDNCGITSIAASQTIFDCSDVGANNITLTVTDVNGNVSSCVAVVTVENVTIPDVVCMDIAVQLDAAGTVTITPTDVDGGSTDSCGIASSVLDIDTFDCSSIGPNNVVLTVTDVNGNVASCTAVVTVEDTILPTLVCMDITLELGADGTATITTADVIDTVDDNCGILSTAMNITDFDCDDIGTPVTVVVSALDNNGNSTICNAVVTVVDLLDPVLTCPADQTVDQGPGALFYDLPDYFATGEATAVDNCTDPIVLTTQSPVAGTLLSDGVHIITLMAEDENGNIASCNFDLTVESTLGVGELGFDISTIVLYPSPANNYIIVDNPKTIPLSTMTIKDLNGRLIKTINLNDMGIERVVDISSLEAAPYIVIIESDHGRLVKQIVKVN